MTHYTARTTLLVISFVAFIVLLLMLAVLGSESQNGAQNPPTSSSSSSQTTSSVTSTTSSNTLLTAKEYKLAGIRPDDTVALLNQQGPEVVINLDHKLWRNIRWSPDGNLLAVLGHTGQNKDKPVFDLFIYDLTAEEWRRSTFYGDSEAVGITGYDWYDADLLYFTQGAEGNNWVHRYGYQSREIVKVFQTSGHLEFTQKSKARIAISKNVAKPTETSNMMYQLVSDKGKVVFTFNSGLVKDTIALKQVLPGRSADEYLFRLLNLQAQEVSYLWDFNNPKFTLLQEEELVVAALPVSTSVSASTTSSEDSVSASSSTTTPAPIVLKHRLQILCVAGNNFLVTKQHATLNTRSIGLFGGRGSVTQLATITEKERPVSTVMHCSSTGLVMMEDTSQTELSRGWRQLVGSDFNVVNAAAKYPEATAKPLPAK